MQDQNDIEKLYENIINFIRSGKLHHDMNMERLIRELNQLKSSDKILVKEKLLNERYALLYPTPTSFPPYILTILRHGAAALQRACIVGFLVCTMNYNLVEKSSITATLAKGIFAGITVFGASLVYDNCQTTLQKQLHRLQLFEDELAEFQIGYEPIKLKFP